MALTDAVLLMLLVPLRLDVVLTEVVAELEAVSVSCAVAV